MSGVLAIFDTEAALRAALERLRDAGVSGVETYTPVALDEHPTGSPLPLLMFLAGLGGFVFFFALMTYADLVSYPINIGGRPLFSWPAFIPIAFELGVLCAMFAGFLLYFPIGGMLRLYEPIDECDGIRAASRDGWVIAVREQDPRALAHARHELDALAPALVEDIP